MYIYESETSVRTEVSKGKPVKMGMGAKQKQTRRMVGWTVGGWAGGRAGGKRTDDGRRADGRTHGGWGSDELRTTDGEA